MVKGLKNRFLQLVAAILSLGAVSPAFADFVPKNAQILAPKLVDAQRRVWPAAPAPHTIAGLIEQETCASLTSSKCWSPRAELKTSREYGFGLGQVTTAYRTDGTERFNKFEELRAQYTSLRGWTWAGRFDPDQQLTAVVEMTRSTWRRFDAQPGASDDVHWAFTLSGYNGGVASVLRDRLLCTNTAGCDPDRWFDNVERTSLKSRIPVAGYGRSWFEINRSYVSQVLLKRRIKYHKFWT